ncbi:MAG: GFA family protein [Pseudomonadota bacterium]
MLEKRTGGCLCGAIRYEVTGPMRPVVACHCDQCRKTSGHHVAATSAPREAVKIYGTPRWYASSSDARRGFCSVCGSNLFWDGPVPHLSIFAGTLDQPTGLQMEGHIYCAHKGDYYEIKDGLPQSDGEDSELTTLVSE